MILTIKIKRQRRRSSVRPSTGAKALMPDNLRSKSASNPYREICGIVVSGRAYNHDKSPLGGAE